jgi:predicted MFS family arabinose efflux permease
MGAGCVLLSYARDDLSFALLSVLAGLAMSPPLIIHSMLVARIARPEHNTEAFTWSATSLLGGVGLGIAGGGVILETQAASQVFLAAGCMGLLAAACSCVLFLRFLRAT